MKRLLLIFVIGLLMVATRPALAQDVKLSVQSREIYSDVPFVLQVNASGFEESPAPVVGNFEIAGAKVSFLGVSPSVMSRQSYVNGRISRSREIRFVFSYRIEASKAGRYTIPGITVTQNNTTVSSSPSSFEAKAVNDSSDMRIDMEVPQRPVWIGESFPVDIVWHLSKNPRDQTFVIPLFDHPAFEVEAPLSTVKERLAFDAGSKKVELPYRTEEVKEKGKVYTKFSFQAIATPTKAGRYELDAPRVVAKLQTGNGRDAFGFRSARYSLFKSTGTPKKFEVKALPLSGRPASFANAVGSGFSIRVTSSRSVVSVGEPIELTLVLGAERGLEGLTLPPLIGKGRLNKELFDLIGDQATGRISDDGKTKTFLVTVALKNNQAQKIPAIDFSYFDPESAEYKTVRSEPIALNVNGAALVGAQDVVGSTKKPLQGKNAKTQAGGASSHFTGDLTPSSGDTTLRKNLSISSIGWLLGALYVIPLLLLALMIWVSRTKLSRGHSGELARALKRVKRAAASAKEEAAESSAGELLNSVRDLAKMTGNKLGPWQEGIESAAFDPKAKTQPVAEKLIDSLLSDAKRWCKTASNTSPTKVSIAVLVLALGFSSSARASIKEELSEARNSYAQSLELEERGARTQGFAKTQVLYQALVKQLPERPELITDWGNAALGAGDVGIATLAYRRALGLDKSLLRAMKNLQWIRAEQPEHLVPNQNGGAVDSLFFWHSEWSLAKRHLIAAFSFAIFILFITPWGRYQVILRRLSIVPFMLFAATLASAVLEAKNLKDAVVVQPGQTLYSADSQGAPAALSTPVPVGVEVSLEERRGNWSQVKLADGTTGWLPSRAVILINE